jgi:hypothetical protein
MSALCRFIEVRAAGSEGQQGCQGHMLHRQLVLLCTATA